FKCTRPWGVCAPLNALTPVSSYSSTVPNLLYQNTGGYGEALMKSSVVKRSIVIDGHKTSVSLEDAFWSGLKEIAEAQQAPLSMVVGEIDQTRQQGNLSSAIRLFVLDHVRTHFRRDSPGELGLGAVSACRINWSEATDELAPVGARHQATLYPIPIAILPC